MTNDSSSTETTDALISRTSSGVNPTPARINFPRPDQVFSWASHLGLLGGDQFRRDTDPQGLRDLKKAGQLALIEERRKVYRLMKKYQDRHPFKPETGAVLATGMATSAYLESVTKDVLPAPKAAIKFAVFAGFGGFATFVHNGGLAGYNDPLPLQVQDDAISQPSTSQQIPFSSSSSGGGHLVTTPRRIVATTKVGLYRLTITESPPGSPTKTIACLSLNTAFYTFCLEINETDSSHETETWVETTIIHEVNEFLFREKEEIPESCDVCDEGNENLIIEFLVFTGIIMLGSYILVSVMTRLRPK